MATIMVRQSERSSLDDVYRIVIEELTQWYGKQDAISEKRCRRLARTVWKDWSRRESEVADETQQWRLYAELYYSILKVLHTHDPIGINYVADEYKPEVETIIPRLKDAASPEELYKIIYEEFVRWFGPQTAG